MKYQARRVWVGPVVLASLSLVAACGGSSGESSKGPTSTAGSAPTEAVADREGSLTLAIAGSPGSFDPIKATTTGENAYLAAIYDQLITIGPDGKSIVPMLATRYELSADAKTLTFTLRDDVRFADGSTFDAAAAKANLDRALGPEASPLVKNALVGVESVEATDASTLVLHTAGGTNLPLTIAVTPQLGMVCPAALADEGTLARNGCGSGLYKLEEQQQSGAAFRRVPGYWNDESDAHSPEQLTIQGVSDQNARINGLVSGQYDAISLFAPTQAELDSIPGGRFDSFTLDPANRYYELGLNTKAAPLDDPRVWQAISLALDRRGIAGLFAKGACVPTAQMATPGTPGYVKSLDREKVWGQDVDKAKRLMADAGFPDGFSVKLTTLSSLQTIYTAIQAQLAAIGIKVTIEPVPTSLVSEWLTGKYGMWLTSFAGSPDLYSVATSLFGPAQSLGAVPSKLTDLIATAGAQEIGGSDRDDTWQSFNRAIVEEPRNPIICATGEVKAAAKNVIGMDHPGLGTLSAALDPRYLGIAKK